MKRYIEIFLLLLLAIFFGQTQAFGFVEDFEYTDSPTNHGWTFPYGPGRSDGYTSTNRAFSGERSYLGNSGADLERSLTDFSVGTISVMYYDDMLSGTNWDIMAYVSSPGGTYDVTGIGWYNPPFYYLQLGASAVASSVPRSAGWHKFEWRFTPSLLEMYVDSIQVASLFLSGEQINSFALGIGTEPGLYGYFDQLMVNPAPEPSTLLLLGAGLVGVAAFRKKFKS